MQFADVSLSRLLFILFLTVPLLELYILIQVGSLVGPLPTVLLCIFTAALGAALIRIQGLQTLSRVQQKLERREMPAVELISGLILLIAGLLLLTPGFFTDTIGFLCLIPPFRERIAAKLVMRLIAGRTHGPDSQTTTLEGEFWEEEETRKRLHR
ncbi:MAG: FxsA family protein [Gammaproteobacteria bacterium]